MIQLARGDDSLILAPEHGGAIVGWTRRATHILRRPTPEALLLGQPGAMGCFPLVPFCNRIGFRRFNQEGRTYELAANSGDSPHAIHGIGWQRPWRVEEVSAHSATLCLDHAAEDEAAQYWPFAFAARLTYQLTDHGLTIEIAATNLHPSPAPMGIGAHPWFPRGAGASIAFEADGVWLTQNALPTTRVPIPPEWTHAARRPVDREPLDHCFTDWRGVARLPDLLIEADAVFDNLQVYTPAGADFFCVEPVSHVPDAINRGALPATQAMTMLAHGQTLSGAMTFSPDASGSEPRRMRENQPKP
jgi:aldose 1-epimerase